MKVLQLPFVSMALLFAIASCTKTDGRRCGNTENAYVTVNNYMAFNNANFTGTHYSYSSSHSYDGGDAVFQLSMHFTNVCSTDSPEIIISEILQTNDPAVHFAASVTEDVSSVQTAVPVIRNGLYANGDIKIGFSNVFGTQPAKFTVINQYRFATQGSFSADSVYFSQNLSKFSTTVNFRVPQ